MVPAAVGEWLLANGHGEVTSTRLVGGGCINNGASLATTTGERYFLKTNPNPPAGMFAREAEGLEALQVAGAPRVPRPYLAGDNFLLLEDLLPAPRTPGYWPEFGRQLARMHLHTHMQFGFAHDNFLGSTPQPNRWTEDGYEFFAEQRLVYQARLAQDHGLLSREGVQQVERLSRRLPELVPAQPASLIHGDLWSGNALTDSSGRPALIDPAAHYGWAEAELAMTDLFGGFWPDFYQAYSEVFPLEKNYRQRFPIYNLYHLLNHLNLFGAGYLGEVQAILRAFA